MRRLFGDLIVVVVSGLLATTVIAADFRLSGFAGGELRYFPDEGQFSGQFDHWQPSLLTSPELRWRMENKDRVTITPFLRVDGQDDKRTHFDLREAYWRRRGEQWDVTIGLDRVFWGVTESRHLVNIINNIDIDMWSCSGGGFCQPELNGCLGAVKGIFSTSTPQIRE